MPDNLLSSYDYELPPDRIAQRPAEKRDASRLMVLRGDAPPEHRTFADLPELLQPGDLLVRNDTRVIPARLLGKRSGGGKTELLLVHPVAEMEGSRFKVQSSKLETRWLCLARPASHLKTGKEVSFGDGELVAVIDVVAQKPRAPGC
ncbi:Queuosine biosynthesis protein [sediment metagenome]|uniref:Queuosine biosynthesis protein n=1 Tax=sediment metagenome TaxID=749907 RepID=D9PKA9_9ZZZZ